jgi:uncharacterized DUF497 family protein
MAYTSRWKIVWDDAKDLANQKKHGISFREAKALFTPGVDYLEYFDDLYPGGEIRFIVIGPIARGPILVVCTARDDDTLRIISARMATRQERELYRTKDSKP